MTTINSSNSGQLVQKVRTAATILAALVLAVVVAFVVGIFSTRVLGFAGRGEVVIVLQFVYTVAPFVGFGVDRFLPCRDDYDHSLIPSGFAMTVVVLIACVVAGVIYGPWTTMAGVATSATVSLSMVRAMAISRHRVSFFVVVFVGLQGLVLLISTALYFAGVGDWRWRAVAYIFPALPLAIWSLVKPHKHTNSHIGGVVEMARTNVPFIASGPGPLTTACSGRALLPVLTSPASLGLFVVVVTATEPLYRIVQSVIDQRTSDQRGREPIPSRVLRHLGIVTAAYGALGAPGGVALYFLIVPIFDHEFEPTWELVLPPTTAAVAFGYYRHLCGEILGSDNPRRTDRVELISAVITVICYPIGILLGDALGLVWTSTVVYLAAAVTVTVALMQPSGGPKNPPTTNEELPVDAIEES